MGIADKNDRHTKRSPEFRDAVARVSDELRQYCKGEDLEIQTVQWLLRILAENTTDSPCAVKAADDEPIFVLRGQDRNSGAVVREWIGRTSWQARVEQDCKYEQLTETLRTKLADAQDCASEMDRYPSRKLAD